MGEITVSAKTVDDAITEALVQLGVTSDKLDYEIIEKGSAGFLGIGMKQAVIRAKVKSSGNEKTESPKRDVKEVREAKKEKQEKQREKRKESIKESNPDEKKEEFVLAEVEEGTMKASETFLKDVLEAMKMENVDIRSEVDEEGALSMEMSGPDMGVLIGKRGQTLDALQYLTNRVANKSQEGYVRVKLDTEDYRRRRQETLEHLAKNIAGKVKRTRRTVSLEPMNPYERRIIHSVLQGDTRVTTHSEGQEPYRRVVVTLIRR